MGRDDALDMMHDGLGVEDVIALELISQAEMFRGHAPSTYNRERRIHVAVKFDDTHGWSVQAW